MKSSHIKSSVNEDVLATSPDLYQLVAGGMVLRLKYYLFPQCLMLESYYYNLKNDVSLH